MIHIGAVIGAIISQGRALALPWRSTVLSTTTKTLEMIGKRDFVACGAGAGVAAASEHPSEEFYSRLKKVLLWTVKLTWRCFFCCLTTVASVYIMISASSKFAHSDSGAMFASVNFPVYRGKRAIIAFGSLVCSSLWVPWEVLLELPSTTSMVE